MKNAREKGGLGLFCILSMCNSLLLSQFLRLLKGRDKKSIFHVSYWIGDTLDDLLPGVDSGPHPNSIPDYFGYIESLVVFARMDDLVMQDKWRLLTNKMIYREKQKSFPVVKVEQDSGISYGRIWQLCMSSVLTASAHDVSYLLLHNKLAVPDRLFRIGVRADPYCDECPGAVLSDCEHFFCSCTRVMGSWVWVKSVLLDLLGIYDMPNGQILGYRFQKSIKENEVVWLLGNYLNKV